MKELYHHGIKGQKWGIRRFQNPDGTLTSEGKKHYSKGNNPNKNIKKQGLEMIVIPAAVWTAEVAIIVAPAIASDLNAKNKTRKYQKERDNAIKTDEKTGFKIKNNQNMSDKDDLSRVNPMHGAVENDGYTSNCMLCTTTYDMRKRGYDVTVNKTDAGFADNKVKDWYPKAKVVEISSKDEYGNTSYERMCKNAIDEISKQPDGARGNLMVTWKGGFGGHSMVYQVKDGKMQILDGQTNKIYKDPSTILNKDKVWYISYARLDNVDFDYKRIKGACTS